MNLLQKIEVGFIRILGSIKWPLRNGLTAAELSTIRTHLASDYYVIVTRNNNHLSTYAINFGDWMIGNGWSYWGHALLNTEDAVTSDGDFELVESTAQGVHVETFANVFDCNSVALLKPKHMDIGDWTKIFTQALADVGKPYDDLFQLDQTQCFSCVELVRNALQADPDYETSFANFEALVQKYNRVTPQMLYECADFEVVYEVRH